MAKNIKKSIMPSKRVFKNNVVNTEDRFYIMTSDEVEELPGNLRMVSATDYAIANQAGTLRQHTCSNGKSGTIYWTSAYYIKKDQWGNPERLVKVIDTKGSTSTCKQNATRPATAPAFQVSARDLKNSNAVLGHNGIYQTVIFPDMQYPQSKVSDALAEELELFYKTQDPKPSSWYMGSTTSDKTWKAEEKDYEYVYKGKRYVRVFAESKSSKDMNFFADGTPCEDGKVYWFAVEPIKWVVANWDTTSLNPNAIGGTDTVILRSEEAIIGGIPFFTEASDNNGILWQNSYIRSMLNGINIRQTLDRGNGSKEHKASTNVDFSNGTKSAFCDVVFKEAVAIEEKKEEPKNPYGIKLSATPKTVEEQLAFYIEKGQSFMLHGSSGVGKTRRVQELDPDYVMIRLRNGILPEEIIGKTAFEDGKPVWIPPMWYKQICAICEREPSRNHVLLIDELTNVRENEQSLVYDIVLEHAISGKDGPLPKNCVIAATGNSPKESTASYNMPEPLFRRFYAHLYLEPDVRSFLTWGGQPHKKFPNRPKVHPAVLSFIAARGMKALCSAYDNDNPPEFAVDPRSWEQVSDIIYAGHGEVDYNLIKNKVGESLARDFVSFINIPQISIDSIVKGSFDKTKLPKDANTKYALMLSLRWADASQVRAVRKFIQSYLGEENLAVYDQIWASQSDENALLLEDLDAEELEHIEE